MQDFHVPNVVDEKRVLETHNETRSVHLNSKDRVGIAVITYLGPLLEVANLRNERQIQAFRGLSIMEGI